MIEVKILFVKDFVPSTGQDIPAEFVANCIHENGTDISVDIMSIRKDLNVRRLSKEYIDIIKANEYSNKIQVSYDSNKEIYVLAKGMNSLYIDFLVEKRNDKYNESKSKQKTA